MDDHQEIEDLGYRQVPYWVMHDVVFCGYVSSMLCERVLDVVEASDLDVLIIRREAYFDFLPAELQSEQRIDFLEGLQISRLSLAPANEPGRIRRRFWEALSMGRIPILIDDQAELPLQDKIDWGSIILRVPEAEIEQLPETIAGYLSTNNDLVLQWRGRMARQIWYKYFGRHE